jgi:hypothetical protein
MADDPALIADYVALPWRVGRRVGRTIYVDAGEPDPNDGSLLIGVMDSPELAAEAVEAHNQRTGEPK